jgi:hypothetical protein
MGRPLTSLKKKGRPLTCQPSVPKNKRPGVVSTRQGVASERLFFILYPRPHALLPTFPLPPSPASPLPHSHWPPAHELMSLSPHTPSLSPTHPRRWSKLSSTSWLALRMRPPSTDACVGLFCSFCELQSILLMNPSSGRGIALTGCRLPPSTDAFLTRCGCGSRTLRRASVFYALCASLRPWAASCYYADRASLSPQHSVCVCVWKGRHEPSLHPFILHSLARVVCDLVILCAGKGQRRPAALSQPAACRRTPSASRVEAQ